MDRSARRAIEIAPGDRDPVRSALLQMSGTLDVAFATSE
jgi:hypothetical protein